MPGLGGFISGTTRLEGSRARFVRHAQPPAHLAALSSAQAALRHARPPSWWAPRPPCNRLTCSAAAYAGGPSGALVHAIGLHPAKLRPGRAAGTNGHNGPGVAKRCKGGQMECRPPWLAKGVGPSERPQAQTQAGYWCWHVSGTRHVGGHGGSAAPNCLRGRHNGWGLGLLTAPHALSTRQLQ